MSRWFCTWYAGGLDLPRKVYAIQERDQPLNGPGSPNYPSTFSSSLPSRSDPIIIPHIPHLEDWHNGRRSQFFLQSKELKEPDGEEGTTLWRMLSEDYTHPRSLSMPRPCDPASGQNPIAYALTFVRGRVDAPQDLLCTAEIVHQIEHWVLNCQALEEVAQANGLTVLRKPRPRSEESIDGISLESLRKQLDVQTKPGESLKMKFHWDLASVLTAERGAAKKEGASASKGLCLTVCQLRLSSLPVQLFRRAASEKMSGNPSREATSKDSSEPYTFAELAERLSQFGEGPMPSRPILQLLLTVRFRYMGSLFDGPRFFTDRYYKKGLAEIGKSLCQGQMLWMLPLFLPHWLPLTYKTSVRSWTLIRQSILNKSLPAFRALHEDRRLGGNDEYDKHNVHTLEQFCIMVDFAKRYGVPWSSPASFDCGCVSDDQALRNGYDDLIRRAPTPTHIWDTQTLTTQQFLLSDQLEYSKEAHRKRFAVRKWNAFCKNDALPNHSLARRFNDPDPTLPHTKMDADASSA